MKCDICRPGFANLTGENEGGCSPCNCNTAGTFNAIDTCDADSGQCLCKDNVEGLRCDTCRLGTTSLSAENPLGCVGCSCDPVGSVSPNCDPETGTCTCRPGVTGERCDECISGFTSLSSAGCVQCSCDPRGSVNDSCSQDTGRCNCRENVVGLQCDSCAPGFYNLAAGCLPCECDGAGTVNGSSGSCDSEMGQCSCKPNVRGRDCSMCEPGFTRLLQENPDGCSACSCFVPNTNTTSSDGAICDPVTSQCSCLPSATGLECELCRDGFYMTGSGCVSCDCNSSGSSSFVCNKTTGDCPCLGNVTGRVCDVCLPGFFQFPRYDCYNFSLCVTSISCNPSLPLLLPLPLLAAVSLVGVTQLGPLRVRSVTSRLACVPVSSL